jgi:hypothetical protein
LDTIRAGPEFLGALGKQKKWGLGLMTLLIYISNFFSKIYTQIETEQIYTKSQMQIEN